MKKITNQPKGVAFTAKQNKAVDSFVATSASLESAHGAMRDACLALIASGLKTWDLVKPALEARKLDEATFKRLRSNWYHYSNPDGNGSDRKKPFDGLKWAKTISGKKGFKKARVLAQLKIAIAYIEAL